MSLVIAAIRPRATRRLGARLAAATIVFALAGAAAGSGWAADPIPGEAPGPTANVRDYGAVGDGLTDDTAAIQRANDAMATMGGGSVVFPAGTYAAMGVRQDSNVAFVSTERATLRHVDGASGTPILSGRETRTSGSISAGSSVLEVVSTKRFVPGAIVGIRAAGGPSSAQASTLGSALPAAGRELVVSDPYGWRVNAINFLWIEDEIVSYTGMSSGIMLNLGRGLFGTSAADHPAGAPVAQAQGLYARVLSVDDGTIVLDRPAIRSVAGADVWVGSVNMGVRGLDLDGRRPSSGSPRTNTVVLRYELARWVRIENNTIHGGAHGAITFGQGTSDSTIANNTLLDNGMPDEGWGSAVWLYNGATSNIVEGNEIGGASNLGVAVDDRTTISTEWDASSDDNTIQANRIDIPRVPGNVAVFVAGSNRNVIADNDLRSTLRGISILRSTQGLNPGDSEGNVVRENRLDQHNWGLYVTGSYNLFEGNTITRTKRPVVDTGTGNIFVAPPPEPTPDATFEATVEPVEPLRIPAPFRPRPRRP